MKVLVVDDDPELRPLVAYALKQSGYLALEAESGERALQLVAQERPDLLILDEPTSGLDPIGRMKVRHLIQRLKNEGKTVFFSSHELGEVETVCDRVGILADGELKAAGRVVDLVTEYRCENLEQVFLKSIEFRLAA